VKCANCKDSAFYVYQSVGSKDIPYCYKHLPGFLKKAAASGLLLTTAEYEQKKAEVLETLRTPNEEAKKKRQRATPHVRKSSPNIAPEELPKHPEKEKEKDEEGQ